MTANREDIKVSVSNRMLKLGMRHIGRKWWILLVAVLLGGVIGAGAAFRQGLWYSAQVVYLTEVNSNRFQQERLNGRDLIMAACDQLEFVQVCHYMDQGFRGMRDMYDETPFRVVFKSIPPHFMDQPFEINFLDSARFSIRSSNLTFEKEGQFGQQLKVGGLDLTIYPTENWRSSSSQHTYEVVWKSESRLVTDIVKHLDVFSHLNSPGKVEVTFQDPNPNKALDFMRAHSQVYMTSLQKAQDDLFNRKLEQINESILMLLADLDASSQFREIRRALGSEKAPSDSLLLGIQVDYQLVERLDSNVALLEAWRKSSFDRPGYATLIATRPDEELDQVYQEWNALLSKQAPFAEIEAKRQELSNLAAKAMLDDSLKRGQAIQNLFEKESRFELLRDAFRSDVRKAAYELEGGTAVIAHLDKLENLSRERLDLQRDIFKSTPNTLISNSAYLMPISPREKQLRIGIVWVFAFIFFGLAILVVSFLQSNEYQVEGFLSRLPKDVVVQAVDTHLPAKQAFIRKTFLTNLLAHSVPSHGILTVTGSQSGSETFAEMLDFLKSSGLRFELISANALQKDGSPWFAHHADWLNRQTWEKVSKLAEEMDFVIVQLPPLGQVPEAAFALSRSQVNLLLLNGKPDFRELSQWRAQLKTGVQNYVLAQPNA